MNSLFLQKYDQKVTVNPVCIWLTGIPGAGKTTLANALRDALRNTHCNPIVLDGDDVRKGICQDLGFDRDSRRENTRRIAEIAKLLFEQSTTAIVASVSPYQSDRAQARMLFPMGKFVEVYVNASLDACVDRDPKGLYASARNGRLMGLTGWNDKYEIPSDPQVELKTDISSIDVCLNTLLSYIETHLQTNYVNCQ